MGLSVGLIVATLVFIVILWKCVITKLGKWARRRLRAFGKTMFVFVQIIVTLPAIIQMPIPVIFVDLMKILKIPALDMILDNLGLACVVSPGPRRGFTIKHMNRLRQMRGESQEIEYGHKVLLRYASPDAAFPY